MAQRPDHRRGHRHLGERLQRLHLREEQGETTSVDTPATSEAGRGRRSEVELLQYARELDARMLDDWMPEYYILRLKVSVLRYA